MIYGMGVLRCEEALARLWEFLDGELPPEGETAVKKHLDVCARCYPRYDFQRAYLRYTRRLRERDCAPPELRRRLFERILEQEAYGRRG